MYECLECDMDFEFFTNSFEQSWRLFKYNVSALPLLIALFFLFTLLIKKKRTFTYIRNVLPESFFNFQAMTINLLFIPILIAVLAPLMPKVTDELGLSFATPFWASIPNWALIPITLFIGDFIGYWRHRLEHSKFLWPSHAMHHSDTQMTWFSLERFHPLNRISTFFVDATLLSLLGLPPLMIFVNSTFRHYYGFWVHSNLPWTYGAFGKVFVSPVMHRWHHARVKQAYNANFASIFSVFDQWFGTYYLPGQCRQKLGANSVANTSYWYQLTYPFKLSSYRRGQPQQVKDSPQEEPL